ncbi:hypothetical protein INT45_007860 [Circinella minor]|uniref:F-box domain-containing protein n=1 Tax=Circinella minor TaxID=1195481 RepID=A0A8H7RXS4_9FUNG|nr:hypothetical protein INT45_007860 [Circinella minor]
MAQNWNVQDNIELGITFLYEGLIQDAYECFTMALNLEPYNVSALSFRAKTALKLNDKRRNTALEDIEAALRVDPCKGELYLIENKILLTKPGQYQEALKRLQKAQFKVLHDDPYIHQISRQLQEQKATQMNYIMDLPTEILYHIMSLLSFRSRIPCLAVSHRWRDTLKHISDLWRDLDYSESIVGRNNYSHPTYYGMTYNRYTRVVHDRHLESCIVTSLGRFMEWTDIRKLKIPLSNAMVEKLIQKRPALYEVYSLVLQLLIREIGSTWRKVEFDSNLEPLNFFHTVSLYCPRLNDLTIQRCQSQRNISNSVIQLLRPIPSVTTLHLSRCVFAPLLLMLSQLFPELHELTIEGTGFVNSLNFHTTLRNVSKLKRLILRDNFSTSGTNLISFLRNEKEKEQQQQLEWLDINNFSLKREGMLSLLETMQSGTLKRFNEEFVMDKQVDRKRLKEMINQIQPAAPQIYNSNA